jgi:hypothetical protein
MSAFPPIKFACPAFLETTPPVDPFTFFSALNKRSPTRFSPFCHGHFGWYRNGQDNSTFIATDIRPDCVLFNTSSLREFGSQVRTGGPDFEAALVFDAVNSLGLVVRCRGTFKLAASIRETVWAARSEEARRMYVTLERFRNSRTQILPEELRVLAQSSKTDITTAPSSFFVAEYHPTEVDFLFLGGGDRCHTMLRYQRSPASGSVWVTKGFHAA